MTVYHIFLSISAVILYLYFTTDSDKNRNNKYRIYSVITILSILLFSPIVSQETILSISSFYYETTVQLKIILLVVLFTSLYFISKNFNDMFTNKVIPLILLLFIVLSPDMSEGISSKVVDMTIPMFTNLFSLTITISHAMILLGCWILFHSWNWRSEYFAAFGWYSILIAITHSELSTNILYQG